MRRRLVLFSGRDFDPHPTAPDGISLSPTAYHYTQYDFAPLLLSWRKAGIENAVQWQKTARAKLAELIGHVRTDEMPRTTAPIDRQFPGGLMRRSTYLRVQPGLDIPVHLLWYDDARRTEPLPVMLCLHGTGSGVHLAWGEERMPADPIKIAAGHDFGRQAARRGYLAACIEQSCFGERRERCLHPRSPTPCVDAAHHALLLGRTLLGERTSDVSSVILWLLGGDHGFTLDPTRLHVVGQSSGGSVALHAAALDERITGVIASACVGFIRDTIARRRDNEGQNVVPGILRWLEADDIVALCAPRPVAIVSGRQDHIWPFAGAKAVADAALPLYRCLGAAGALTAAAGEGPHRFYPDIAWSAFEEVLRAVGQDMSSISGQPASGGSNT